MSARSYTTRGDTIIWHLASGIWHLAHLAPAAELAKHRADVETSMAKDVRRVMARGLENLTGIALETALAAREKAYLTRIAAAQAGAKAVRENPVVTGMSLAAAGATVALLLPQSSHENRVLAAPRDQLVGTAKRALQDQRQRLAKSLERVAQALSP